MTFNVQEKLDALNYNTALQLHMKNRLELSIDIYTVRNKFYLDNGIEQKSVRLAL